VRRRADVEGQIIQHSRALEKAYEAANREMTAAARGRLEDLEPDDDDDDDGQDLGGHDASVKETQIPDNQTVKKA
jgi:hypothetical protein